MSNWFEKLFINEAKPALDRHAGGVTGTPVTAASADEMEAILLAATEEDCGKIYQYLGETTEDYTQGEYYILSKDE